MNVKILLDLADAGDLVPASSAGRLPAPPCAAARSHAGRGDPCIQCHPACASRLHSDHVASSSCCAAAFLPVACQVVLLSCVASCRDTMCRIVLDIAAHGRV